MFLIQTTVAAAEVALHRDDMYRCAAEGSAASARSPAAASGRNPRRSNGEAASMPSSLREREDSRKIAVI